MNNTWRMVPLGQIAEPISRPVVVEPGQRYRTIGVKLWGEGAYERETMDGTGTAAKVLSVVRKDDLIINEIWVRHGSIAVAGERVDGCVGSGEFPTFQLDPTRIIPRWLHWLSKTKQFWTKCDHLSQGTSGKNRIQPEKFLTIAIPLPELPEQQRIVARIAEVAGHIAQAKGLQEQAVVELETLASAVSGRLFPADGRAVFAPLESVCTAIIDCLHSNPIYAETGVPTVRSPDVGWGVLHLETARRTGEAEYRRRTGRGEPTTGDLVLVREGGGTGKAALVREGQRFSLGQRVMLLRPDRRRILPEYFLYQWLSPVVYEQQVLPLTKGSASPHLNIGAIKRFQLRVPDMAEQRQVVAHLLEVRRQIQQAVQLHAANRAELDVLLPAILDKAFRGEL
jgi:type I restriction enzyme S subunit